MIHIWNEKTKCFNKIEWFTFIIGAEMPTPHLFPIPADVIDRNVREMIARFGQSDICGRSSINLKLKTKRNESSVNVDCSTIPGDEFAGIDER